MTGTHRPQLDDSLSTRPQPVVVLVNPQMGENIGAAARAMLNCGLFHLRLVAPRDGWPSERAEAMAAGALELMPSVEVYESVQEAVADCHTVFATTARARDLVKPVMTPRSAADLMQKKIGGEEKVAILFGAERSGLSNEDVALAHILITIPLNPGFSSLNLAQSVLLMAYEWSQFLFEAPEVSLPLCEGRPATHEEFSIFFNRLDEELQKRGFFRVAETKDSISRNIRGLFSRIQPSDKDIKLLHGIVSSLIGLRKKEPVSESETWREQEQAEVGEKAPESFQ